MVQVLIQAIMQQNVLEPLSHSFPLLTLPHAAFAFLSASVHTHYMLPYGFSPPTATWLLFAGFPFSLRFSFWGAALANPGEDSSLSYSSCLFPL